MVRKKFARLRGLLVKLVVSEDAFGLRERKPYKVSNTENYDQDQARDAHGRWASGVDVDELRHGEDEVSKGFRREVDSGTGTLEMMREFPQAEFVENSFCPTGEGGGIDPSCSPTFHYSVRENSIHLELIRTYKPGQHEEVMRHIYEAARSNKKSKITGSVTGEARRRLFTRLGWKVTSSRDRGDATVFEIEIQVPPRPTTNRFQFHSSPDKVLEFQKWLRLQFKSVLLGKSDEELWAEFARRGYEKGAGRAFEDVNKKRRWLPGEGDFYGRSKQEFLKSSFGRAESTDKLRLLASRSFTDLRNVTEDMATRMGRTLMDGLARGANPRELVDGLMDDLEVSEVRAEAIARTEIIRAHAEGQLDAMEKLGVEEVGVAVEWDTAKDGRVCPRCKPLQGVVLTIQEAHGLIPNHPNCRCAFVPANVGEDTSKQLRTKQEILDAFEEADVDPPELDEKRPEPLVEPTKNELHEFSRLVRSL